MPLLIIPFALLVIMLVAIASVPLGLLMRYKGGTARRPARAWLVTLNLVGLVLSTLTLLFSAGVTTLWVPHAFAYALAGTLAGCVLGLLGLAVTRWEDTPRALLYTPNRWVVLALTLIVSVRLAYGLARAWNTWRAAPESVAWVAASGTADSLAVGAIVLGYYLVYWAGVRRRLKRRRVEFA